MSVVHSLTFAAVIFFLASGPRNLLIAHNTVAGDMNVGGSFGFIVVNDTLSNTQVINNAALGVSALGTASLRVDGATSGVTPLGLSWLANVYLHSPQPIGNAHK